MYYPDKKFQRMKHLFSLLLLLLTIAIAHQKKSKDVCAKLKFSENLEVKYIKFRPGRISKVGSRLKFRCAKGYTLLGSTRTKCKRNGKWSKELPICVDGNIRCPKPELMMNGTVNADSRKPGDSIVYKCDEGFTLIGQGEIECRKSGTWSHKAPKCVAIKCKAPYWLKNFKNGYFIKDNANLEYGTTITFFCNKNYEVLNTDYITCGPKGKWSPRFPMKCRRTNCGDPGRPENGRRFGSNFTAAANVSFFCRSGFTLIGSSLRTCQSNGLWSGEIAICDDNKSHCPNPGVPANGRRIGGKFNKGDVVMFECLPGFTLVGDRERQCTQHGNWTGRRPYCLDDNRVVIPPLEETSKLFMENMVSKLSTKTCKKDEDGKCIRSRGRSLSTNDPKGLDVIFMIDSSSSIGIKNFKLTLDFVCKLIVRLGVDYGKGGTRVAAVTFSTKAYLAYNIGDPGVATSTRACKKTNNIKYSGGGTNIERGLALVNQTILYENKEKRNRALILITDGRHNYGGSPIDEANRLKKRYKLQVYVIGIGKNIKPTQLGNIASKSKKTWKPLVFHLQSQENFTTLIDKMVYTDYKECGVGANVYGGLGRVAGGQDANETNLWPWQVAIYLLSEDGKSYYFKCGGSIISNTAIVTAAHCLEKDDSRIQTISDPYRYSIVAGKLNIVNHEKVSSAWMKQNGTKVREIYPHPKFEFGSKQRDNYEDDIAIFELTNPLVFSRYIRRICLPKPNDYLKEGLKDNKRQIGFVSGWGYVDKDKRKVQRLQYLGLRVNSNETCELGANVAKKMFCTGEKDGLDACQGDSGGPFSMYDSSDRVYKLVGVVSWGDHECQGKTLYGYLTRVTNYLSWIKKTLKEFFKST